MARMITTIGIPPELINEYNGIVAETGNFSKWVVSRIKAHSQAEEQLIRRIDALERQIEAIEREMWSLYKKDGYIRDKVKELPTNAIFFRMEDKMEQERKK